MGGSERIPYFALICVQTFAIRCLYLNTWVLSLFTSPVLSAIPSGTGSEWLCGSLMPPRVKPQQWQLASSIYLKLFFFFHEATGNKVCILKLVFRQFLMAYTSRKCVIVHINVENLFHLSLWIYRACIYLILLSDVFPSSSVV